MAMDLADTAGKISYRLEGSRLVILWAGSKGISVKAVQAGNSAL